MGIVNVTPDSFSDGGQWYDTDVAIAHARHLLTQGADIIDVGGESTRPGAAPVTPGEEAARVLPVVEALAGEGAVVSVDTVNAATAEAVVAAGAQIVNDVSGGLADATMAEAVARAGAVYVIQHWRGTPETMNSLAVYDDVVAEVCGELRERVDQARAAGVQDHQIVLDPGLGFAKNADHNWTLLAHLDAVAGLGYPVLVGASRKRFLSGVVPPALAAEPLARDHATTAVSALAAQAGAWAVRVHEVAATADAVRVAAAWRAHR
ncbi:dihydropteroate synthase [Georgenia thermotolerans]|uniref:Dihydropteroate synthase n=1 Tax=Georgenia thermotolerans TaxID=527326 RepID=A0A7J5UNB2_9MICO|nr:dihydropteroate synthase [Georgenia thermotolerans]KAE8763875.1 dihydropteroate synthase [Georgenia thermotolerans]